MGHLIKLRWSFVKLQNEGFDLNLFIYLTDFTTDNLLRVYRGSSSACGVNRKQMIWDLIIFLKKDEKKIFFQKKKYMSLIEDKKLI